MLPFASNILGTWFVVTDSEALAVISHVPRRTPMQIQDRIRYDFGVRQLQNTLKSTRSGQRPRKPGATSSVYTLCRTVTQDYGTGTRAARPNTSSAAPPQPGAAPLGSTGLDVQERVTGQQTVLPSAAWALEGSHGTAATGIGRSPGCRPNTGHEKRGTPKVGLSTWGWGGASATLSAVAGIPISISTQAQDVEVPMRTRPQTARPFRIRSRIDSELQSGASGKVLSPPNSCQQVLEFVLSKSCAQCFG